MKKKKKMDAILEEAARMVVEKDFQEQNKKAMKSPHTVSPEFQMKMNRLFTKINAFTVCNQSETADEDEPFLIQLDNKWKNRSSLWSYRRYIAAVALLMLGVSGAVLASDDIRNGLNRLRLQFFSDNVTIEASPESITDQEGADAASEEFHAYKWKEVPEGYRVVYEEENEEFKSYFVNYENNEGNYIYYSQHYIEYYQGHISYDEQAGYQQILDLNGIAAYSISDGRNNTIFYEKDGYLFEFMSDQPEEIIKKFISMSKVLEYGS